MIHFFYQRLLSYEELLFNYVLKNNIFVIYHSDVEFLFRNIK